MGKIKILAKWDRPREKLQNRGAQALSDLELMAVLLGSGTSQHDVMALAEKTVKVADQTNAEPALDDLLAIDGIGPAKAGLVNQSQVHPREVYADPITDRASAIIVAHNHPAGSLYPSKQDVTTTRRLKAAGETLGIHLLDHIIFNHKGYYSFLEDRAL